jgi:hypothetical protein
MEPAKYSEDMKALLEEEKPEPSNQTPKKVIRLLYKKCVDCSYLVPNKDNIEKCSTNPECPAKALKFIFGSDPKVFAKSVAELTFYSKKFPENEKVKKELGSALIKLKNRKEDTAEILMNVSQHLLEMQKEEEISDVNI